MEDQWLEWSKRLQAIASTGLFFTRDEFDKERYAEIAGIANAMLASIGGIPVSRIEGLVSDFAKGYATPKIDVRGAVIEGSRILLVRERSDGLWTMPGGFADIGLSPTENVIKEIWEEANINAEVVGLYSIKHKAKHDYDPDVRDFYKIFFLCKSADRLSIRPNTEIMDADFFSLDSLPPLSKGRIIESDIHDAFAFRSNMMLGPSVD